MIKPRLLDLFCGAGGAAMGYHRAGFEVVGVDIKPQPHYPFEFWQMDLTETGSFDSIVAWTLPAVIHASPPCQAFTVYGNNRAHIKTTHPNLIPPIRSLLRSSGLPYVIENVPGAPLESPIRLCGTSFGIPVRRHRLFETSSFMLAPPCDHGRFTERRFPGSSNRPNGRTVCNVGEYRVPLVVQREAMEMPWADLYDISQAIPPAYTEWIGKQLMSALEAAA